MTLDATGKLWHQVRGISIVGLLKTAEEVVAALETRHAADVLVCSNSFWEVAYSLLPVTSRRHFTEPAIVVTGPDREIDCRNALQRGVTAYVPLSHGFGDLVTAVKVAASGYMFYPQSLLPRLPDTFDDAWQAFDIMNAGALSRRQLDVIRLVAQGMSDKQIANMLSISVRTVQGIVSDTLSKLGVHSRIHLVLLIWGGHRLEA